VATTNSVSGFITRDGGVAIRTQEFTAQSMVVEMPLRSALTPAILIAPWLERGLALMAVLACFAALVATTRQARAAMLVERSEAMNTGSRAAVLRRSEQTSVSSASDDEVGGLQSGASNN